MSSYAAVKQEHLEHPASNANWESRKERHRKHMEQYKDKSNHWEKQKLSWSDEDV